jgi:hypothetical protein
LPATTSAPAASAESPALSEVAASVATPSDQAA